MTLDESGFVNFKLDTGLLCSVHHFMRILVSCELMHMLICTAVTISFYSVVSCYAYWVLNRFVQWKYTFLQFLNSETAQNESCHNWNGHIVGLITATCSRRLGKLTVTLSASKVSLVAILGIIIYKVVPLEKGNENGVVIHQRSHVSKHGFYWRILLNTSYTLSHAW